jgi:hypothetical protein
VENGTIQQWLVYIEESQGHENMEFKCGKSITIYFFNSRILSPTFWALERIPLTKIFQQKLECCVNMPYDQFNEIHFV